MQIVLEPIGYVRTQAPDQMVKESWESVVSDIEIDSAHGAGLSGIDGFSHLIVLFFMHRLAATDRSVLQVKPRGLARLGLKMEELPLMGVFACDAPPRPNPVGLSIVELVGRTGTVLHVRGLDAFDGTPVIDIKPYTPDRVVREPQTPD